MKKYLFFILPFPLIVNPLTEQMYQENLLALMASHYALFFLGFLLGVKTSPRRLWFLGLIAPVLVHVPPLFQVFTTNEALRVLSEVSLVLSGTLLGSGLPLMSTKVRLFLFGSWMLGDTILSVDFLVGGENFASPFTPYSIYQVRDTGVFMFLIMNLVAFFIIMKILLNVFERS
jgi:Protein of unknown function (DUF1404).